MCSIGTPMVFGLTLGLFGCGGGSSGTPTYTVGGTVSGLAPGSEVVLTINSGDSQTVTANSSFTFSTAIEAGGSYNVTVATPPPGQTCIVDFGSGTVTTANVTNINVQCPLEQVMWSFGFLPDGFLPAAGLIQASDGNFYGTTVTGGPNRGGTVFKITPDGVETIVWSFGVPAGDGANPYNSPLIQGRDGNFYGTTRDGGANLNYGTVYQLTPAGVETVLWSFGAVGDGSYPETGVIYGADDNLYGTTFSGGANIGGTVFRVTSAGAETVLWSFDYVSTSVGPNARLVQGSDGNFYGSTAGSGPSDGGSIFRITPSGVYTVLWTFGTGQDGLYPSGRLMQASDGNLYGTTISGGTHSGGTVYKLTPGGVETVLWNFGGPGDGQSPEAGVIQGMDGNFYGTTGSGGPICCGTVFRLTPAGVENVLWGFGPSNVVGSGGAQPIGDLLQGTDGSLYGTTYGGGTAALGTVYKVIL